MDPNDVDFTADLNGTGENTVNVNESNVPAHGQDALELNNQNPPVREPPPQPQKVGEPAPADGGEKPKSLRDQISSALKGEGDTPPIAQQDGRPRNPDGTFAAAPAAPVVDPNAPPAPAAVAAPQGIDPQVFQTLPAETQAFLARTMDDLGQRQQQYARLERVDQILSTRRDAWALNGMTEDQALGQLLALSDFAGRDPPGFIKYMAENNNVDLEELVLGQEPVDPQYAALQQEVAQLRNERTQETQQQLQAAHQQTVNSVVTFASEKDQGGKLLRPYFEELGSEVLPFISTVKAQNPNLTHNQVLQEAYDRACWGSPAVRAKMLASQQAASEAERLRGDVNKVERARSASVSVKSGAPSTAPTPPNDASRTLRDTIKASMAAAG